MSSTEYLSHAFHTALCVYKRRFCQYTGPVQRFWETLPYSSVCLVFVISSSFPRAYLVSSHVIAFVPCGPCPRSSALKSVFNLSATLLKQHHPPCRSDVVLIVFIYVPDPISALIYWGVEYLVHYHQTETEELRGALHRTSHVCFFFVVVFAGHAFFAAYLI